MPPLLADFIHAGACIPICEKFLTRPHGLKVAFLYQGIGRCAPNVEHGRNIFHGISARLRQRTLFMIFHCMTSMNLFSDKVIECDEKTLWARRFLLRAC